jgi:hypothetical protein
MSDFQLWRRAACPPRCSKRAWNEVTAAFFAPVVCRWTSECFSPIVRPARRGLAGMAPDRAKSRSHQSLEQRSKSR